ncbi:MAG: hypothetical protein A2505_08665 [Deltaproteobacteria bacterium RIFOXYD12_FULL_55_16]|nr:MAG: hypothetical protein A2505_08665 [Deltaproteobacteria bacterium RIFOXYD12_FULL_55_16]
MRKKIILGVLVFSLLFLISGGYIVFSIERGVTTLNNLIKLHRVELLREHLLLDLKRVQADLQFKNTRYAREASIMVTHARTMGSTMGRCFGCHHPANIVDVLTELQEGISQYQDAISRVLTIRADVARLEEEEDTAFQKGNELVKKVNVIIEIANEKLGKKTETTLQAIEFSKKILFALVIIGPLIAITLGILLARSIARPISVLLGATKRIKNAEWNYRIQEDLEDEFAELADAFNEMTYSINQQCQEMQRAEQLTVYGEMAAGLAHEIKTPLAGIKGAMKLIETEMPAENRLILEKAVGEIRRIESLMKELLLYARPSKPSLMLINFNELLDKIMVLLPRYPTFARVGPEKIIIVKEFAEDMPEVATDPLQQQQIFLNLMLNAADAMPEGGVLTVRTRCNFQENWLEVVVADTGQGIAAGLADKIFKPFFTTKAKGTGLGLATTKRLVQQFGGSITVVSQAAGTAFKIRFPLEQKARIEKV